jgi:hypothetical protein
MTYNWGRRETHDILADFIEVLQEDFNLIARHGSRRVAIWSEHVLERVGIVRDLSLFDDPRCALQSVSKS